jgi:hypothetical protein
LTGETREQKFLLMIGYSASNGKSSLAKIFMNSLNIYSVKLDKQTFNINYTKAHKQFAMIKKPIRFVYMEELDKTKLDVDRLKDFVDGDKIGGNEILYGTVEDIKIYSKLYCTSNKDPKFDNDEGIKRRGLMEILTNKFVEKEEYDKNKDKSGYYIRDNELEKKFEREEYKMAFINILIPYAKKYYEEGLKYPNIIRKTFGDLCDENDDMKVFIENYYEITNNENDKIHKDDFLETYNIHNKTKKKWNDIMSDVKRILTYKRDFQINGRKGVITGLKLIENKNNIDSV